MDPVKDSIKGEGPPNRCQPGHPALALPGLAWTQSRTASKGKVPRTDVSPGHPALALPGLAWTQLRIASAASAGTAHSHSITNKSLTSITTLEVIPTGNHSPQHHNAGNHSPQHQEITPHSITKSHSITGNHSPASNTGNHSTASQEICIKTLEITPHSITTLEVTPHSITTLEITPHSITTLEITPHSITTLEITPHSITSLEITPHSITTLEITHQPLPQSTLKSLQQHQTPEITPQHSRKSLPHSMESLPASQRWKSHSIPKSRITKSLPTAWKSLASAGNHSPQHCTHTGNHSQRKSLPTAFTLRASRRWKSLPTAHNSLPTASWKSLPTAAGNATAFHRCHHYTHVAIQSAEESH
nr:uncharacterized protein LOC113804983 [Penaeus vannamei]